MIGVCTTIIIHIYNIIVSLMFFVPTHDFHTPEICQEEEEEVTQEMFREFQYVFQMMKMFVAYSFQISCCFRVFQKVSHKKKPALLSMKYWLFNSRMLILWYFTVYIL